MKDTVYLGETPYGEECTPVGTNPQKERAECQAFINQIRRQFGPEPPNTRLYIKRNSHDFGTYLSVECEYDDTDRVSYTYAFKVEGDAPEYWDDDAKRELGLQTGGTGKEVGGN